MCTRCAVRVCVCGLSRDDLRCIVRRVLWKYFEEHAVNPLVYIGYDPDGYILLSIAIQKFTSPWYSINVFVWNKLILIQCFRSFGYSHDQSVYPLTALLTCTINLCIQDAVLSQRGPRDAAVNFDTYRILQWHRADSLPQHGFLVLLVFVCRLQWICQKWQVLERTSQIAYLTQASNHVITFNYYRHHYSPPT